MRHPRLKAGPQTPAIPQAEDRPRQGNAGTCSTNVAIPPSEFWLARSTRNRGGVLSEMGLVLKVVLAIWQTGKRLYP